MGPITNSYENATRAAVKDATAKGLQVHYMDLFGPPRDGCAGHPGIGVTSQAIQIYDRTFFF